MAKSRQRHLNLAKFIENSSTLVAVIDSQYEIRFANPACCRWLDVEPSELIGKKCQYNTQADEGELPATSGICPPPQVFDGQAVTSAIRRICQGRMELRKAVFSPLKEGDQQHPSQVLMIASEANAPDCHPHSLLPNDIVDHLHQELAAIWARNSSRFINESFVGASLNSQRVRRQITLASGTNSDFCVVGPVGTGREHVARTIFHNRQRHLDQNSELIPIHCAIADSRLIQASIKQWVFDQKEGDRRDWLLLLDVDQLGAQGQNELLGFAQLPEFELNMIATALKPLSAKECTLSRELANLLSTLTIEIAPLSHRPEDIPILAQSFVECNNVGRSVQMAGFSDEALELLCEYHWPRNVDELKQVVDMACESANGTHVNVSDLPSRLMQGISASRAGRFTEEVIQLDEYLQEIETELIRRAMRQSGNNKSKAAQLLGINRAKLLRRLAHLGLDLNASTATSDQTIDSSVFEEAD